MGYKASTEVGNVGPLGHVCRRKEREEKKRMGVDYGGSLGAGTIKQEERGQAEPTGELGIQQWVDSMGPMGPLNRKPMVDYVQRGTYAGCQWDDNGRQRGTLIRW